MIRQLIKYASKAKCVRECKAKRLTPKQQYPDPETLNRFKQREPYSFLHFAYYQVGGKDGERGGRKGGRKRGLDIASGLITLSIPPAAW